MTLESSSDSVVDTLRLSPASIHAFIAIGLVAMEPLRAYSTSIPQGNSMGARIFTLFDDGHMALCGNHLRRRR